MTFRFPDFTVGLGHRHHAVTVFPLYMQAASPLDYDLAADALARGAARVDEMSAQGQVDSVRVTNDGPKPILFLEGEQLVGAKQNRIMNTTTLVPAKGKATVPVSCVERGRWHGSSCSFSPAFHVAPAGLRRVVKASVTRNVITRAGYIADQQGVWSCIARGEERLGGHSPTQALQDLFATNQQRLHGFQATLQYVQRACGVAMGVGPRIVSIDLFDKPSTCRAFWERLLVGTALDALQSNDQLGSVDTREVHGLVAAACASRWVRASAVGLGEEFRSRDVDHAAASALAVGGTFIHISIAGR